MAGFPKDSNRRAEKAKRPHRGIKIDSNVISELLVAHSGNVSAVADALGCSRWTISGRIDADAELQQVCKQCRERWIDKIEESVLTRAHEGSDTALQKFVLSTQARHRGWDNMEASNSAKDIASAAFSFILDKSKNPAAK